MVKLDTKNNDNTCKEKVHACFIFVTFYMVHKNTNYSNKINNLEFFFLLLPYVSINCLGGGGIHAEFWPSVIYIKILELRLDICKKQFIFYILVSQQDFPLKSFAKIP